jgi:hypothetical protein
MTDHWVREVPCRDVALRPRRLRVFVEADGTVGMSAPPGEVAWLQPAELRQLQQILVNASIEAAHRGSEYVGD